jgi:hypothetical protein
MSTENHMMNGAEKPESGLKTEAVENLLKETESISDIIIKAVEALEKIKDEFNTEEEKDMLNQIKSLSESAQLDIDTIYKTYFESSSGDTDKLNEIERAVIELGEKKNKIFEIAEQSGFELEVKPSENLESDAGAIMEEDNNSTDEVATEEVTNGTPHEEAKEEISTEVLAKMYRNADPKVFGSSGSRKSLSEVREEVRQVLSHESFSKDEINKFINGPFQQITDAIQAENRSKSKEGANIKDINANLADLYNALRNLISERIKAGHQELSKTEEVGSSNEKAAEANEASEPSTDLGYIESLEITELREEIKSDLAYFSQIKRSLAGFSIEELSEKDREEIEQDMSFRFCLTFAKTDPLRWKERDKKVAETMARKSLKKLKANLDLIEELLQGKGIKVVRSETEPAEKLDNPKSEQLIEVEGSVESEPKQDTDSEKPEPETDQTTTDNDGPKVSSTPLVSGIVETPGQEAEPSNPDIPTIENDEVVDKFKAGDTVKILDAEGNEEDGWVVHDINSKTKRAVVVNKQGAVKEVYLYELFELNKTEDLDNRRTEDETAPAGADKETSSPSNEPTPAVEAQPQQTQEGGVENKLDRQEISRQLDEDEDRFRDLIKTASGEVNEGLARRFKQSAFQLRVLMDEDLAHSFSKRNVNFNLAFESDTGEEEFKKIYAAYQRTKRKIIQGLFEKKGADYIEQEKLFYDSFKASRTQKIKAGVRKYLGINPEIPPHLAKLEEEYNELTQEFLSLHNAGMSELGKRRKGDEGYYAERESIKDLVQTKYFLKTTQELIAIQEQSLLSPEAQERLERISGFMKKHKWTARVGIVTLSATGAAIAAAGAGLAIGAVATGAAAAGAFTAARMGASILTGLTAAKLTNKAMQGRVNEAENKLTATREEMKGKVWSMDVKSARRDLSNAQRDILLKQRQQKATTIAAAAVAGGASGFTAGAYGDQIADFAGETLDSVKTRADNVGEFFGGDSGDGAEIPPADGSSPEGAIPAGAENSELTETVDTMMVNQIKIPHYNAEGILDKETFVSNVKLIGEHPSHFLDEAAQKEVTSYLTRETGRLLEAHPHMTKTDLESELFKPSENRYGNNSWWEEAGVSKVNIVDIYSIDKDITAAEAVSVEQVNTEETISETTDSSLQETIADNQLSEEAAGADVVPGEEIPPIEQSEMADSTAETLPKMEHTVEKGETLWEIIEKDFAEELAKVPEGERNAVLDELFDKARADADLRATLELKSGDIDLIYPGENLKLTGLGEELKNIIEDRESSTDTVTEASDKIPTKSGTLPIEPDTNGGNVKLTVSGVDIPLTGDASETINESLPKNDSISSTYTTPPEIPKSAVLTGRYFDYPAYKEYIASVYGSEATFNRLVENEIYKLEKITPPNFLDKLLGYDERNYVSPYSEGLRIKDMTVNEFNEFKKEFSELSSRDRETVFSQRDINPKTYDAWIAKIDEMTDKNTGVIYDPERTPISDIFKRFVAQTPVKTNLIA